MSVTDYYIGVDVGTGSARAALVSSTGKVLSVNVQPIQTWNPKPDHYEQSSENIWSACLRAIKIVIKGYENQVRGLGFDATCSLVVLDKNGDPVTVSTTGDANQNVILWMDHRAHEEAKEINETQHEILQNVGGKISLEMETPKLKWLKKNLPNSWKLADKFFDLPDFLTFKATGSESRSLCSLVCKWCYKAGSNGGNGWSRSYLEAMGLSDLLDNDAKRIGSTVLPPGALCGYLTKDLVKELGLGNEQIPVATSIIDAHAGALGMLGCSAPGVAGDFQTRMGLICGTSTCHMVVQDSAKFVNGVWGPYYSALVPEMWLSEAGQSATGALLDHVVKSHPAYSKITDKINLNSRNIYEYLNDLLDSIAAEKKVPVSRLTQNVHVWPDFHGNRSPVADPNLKGMICGLSLSNTEENLAVLYLAFVQALCYGTEHILETLRKGNVDEIKTILICGGLSRNKLFVQTQADVCSLTVLLPAEKESVLIGAAVLGACAAQKPYSNISDALKSMGGAAAVIKPNESDYEYHILKYKVFLKMLQDQRYYEKIMCDI